MSRASERSDFTERIIRVIRSIPEGQVLTYGGVAAAAGNPRGARAVVWVLHSSSEKERLPWHRVVNVRGECSTDRVTPTAPGRQRKRLEAEGVGFGADGRVDMARYRWQPDEEA